MPTSLGLGRVAPAASHRLGRSLFPLGKRLDEVGDVTMYRMKYAVVIGAKGLDGTPMCAPIALIVGMIEP